MGDCLLFTAPIRALKEEFPSFRLAVLVEARFADCFDGNSDFDEILVAGNKLSTAAALVVRRFDAIVNLHGGPTSLMYTLLPWGKRIGAEQYQYSRLYHGLVPKPDSTAHTVESTMSLLRWLGLSAGATAPALRYQVHPLEAARNKEKVNVDRPYAVIHPASVMSTKRWDAHRFAAVGRSLLEQGLVPVVTAGPGEESFARQVAQDLDCAIVVVNLTIPELAELIRGARIYIGNDSGPMHLAAAVGTPTIAIWGSSDSRRWHPWNVAHRVVQNPFECNPCPGYRCLVAESPLCIESISVEQVNAAVQELLALHESKSR
jgi:ADP-heptose:LPS heptosyltransferase